MTPEQLADALRAPLGEVLAQAGGVGEIEPQGERKDVSDATVHLLVRTERGRPSAMVHCAAASGSDLVRRTIDRGSAVKERIGPRLGAVILEPILDTTIAGVTVAAFPWCQPYSDHRVGWPLQRARLRPEILGWLHDATRASAKLPDDDLGLELFGSALTELANGVGPNAGFRSRSKTLAARGEERISTGAFAPRVVASHNDLWKHNLLRRPASNRGNRYGFVIIDWPGARVEGHAFFDLIRVAISLKSGARRLAGEVVRHSRALGCAPIDAFGYLAAALGVMARDLGEFEPERFVAMGEACFDALEAAVATLADPETVRTDGAPAAQ
jgi:hypothetical protein